jgi:hypothetical protein
MTRHETRLRGLYLVLARVLSDYCCHFFFALSAPQDAADLFDKISDGGIVSLAMNLLVVMRCNQQAGFLKDI